MNKKASSAHSTERAMEQVIKDGIRIEAFNSYTKDFISKYTDGKPVVLTIDLFEVIGKSQINIYDIWNKYITWRLETMPTLPEEEQIFVTNWRGREIWVVEDAKVITMMLPGNY